MNSDHITRICPETQKRSEGAEKEHAMSGELIMVVDDNPVNLRLACALLRRHGYEVCTAEDGKETLAVLRNAHPRLILMDVQLPDVDGLTLTRRLKADPTTQSIIIVALTAYAMKGDEQKARDAGCNGYIPKPIETRTFIKTMTSFLEAQ
jgi:two-component system cell cycle response regulator